jgi:hypothetical protein
MLTWTCNNAYDLRNDTIIHEAMTGKAVNVMASTTILSNSGVNNQASFENMKKNNFYYFQYAYLCYYYQFRQSLSDSFFAARKAYVEETLKHTDIYGEGNYQFNLNNALEYQYLGVLEKSPYSQLPLKIPNTSGDASSQKTQPFNVNITYTDDGAGKVTLCIDYKIDTKSKDIVGFVFNPPNGDKIKAGIPLSSNKGAFKIAVDKDIFFGFDKMTVNIMVDNKDSNFYPFIPDMIKKKLP